MRAIVAMVLGALLAGLPACTSPPPSASRGRLEPVARLVDQDPDGASRAPAPTAIVGGVRRPILPRTVVPSAEGAAALAPAAGERRGTYTSSALVVPDRAVLRLALGIAESAGRPPGGAAFRVVLLSGDGEEVVLDEPIDPASDASARAWAEREVDLGRFAGKEVRLRFETEPVAGGDGTSASPVWGDPTVLAPAAARERRNVLLISLDTLRADHLGAYGYARPTSPTIDSRLAARGTVFERAYSPFPSTAASHMTVFTSLLPCAHGVTGISLDDRLADQVATLPELLRREGYATAAFVENAWVTHLLGFARGFGTWIENVSPQLTAPVGQAEKTFSEAGEWIAAHADQPWLVFVHTYQVHHPYSPPPGYVEQVVGKPGVTRPERDAALYDAEIRYTDDLLARFLAELERLDALRDTLVVLFSDHGEHFGEHGQYRHGFSLHEELLHVPLVLTAPGAVPGGRRVAAEVGLIDVSPTILDLLDLPPAEQAQGRSLTPLLRGGELPPRPLFAELPILGLVAAREDGAKHVIDTKRGKAQRIDLEKDPGENAVVEASVDAPDVARLLADFGRLCAAYRPPAERSRGDEASSDGARQSVHEKLKALGYLD